MFKIIEKVSGSVRLPIKPGINLKPGMIGKIINFNNDTVVDLGDTSSFSGIVGNRRNSSIDIISWDKKHFVKLWMCRMVFRTNIFDKDSEFKDSRLFVNDNGLLTSKEPNKNAIIAARLISPPKDREWIEALWL